MKIRASILVLLLALLPQIGLARDGREQQRIDFLIRSVETSKGIKFIRNGSEYDGAAAAKHLRMKLDYAGERVKTAEEFVKGCASESSITHRKYSIRLADGSTTEAATYFAGKLREFDDKK
ncbi:MAG: DUF5329 domain-containing protein [Verrucomicrobiota bacterium]|nr:DUF5329 domain-containing protein [Verrucomicrobiota bacterium]